MLQKIEIFKLIFKTFLEMDTLMNYVKSIQCKVFPEHLKAAVQAKDNHIEKYFIFK